MNLTGNEQRIINSLLENPRITNRNLAMAVFMSLTTLNKTFKHLYTKFDIKGSGRHKRVELIQILLSLESKICMGENK